MRRRVTATLDSIAGGQVRAHGTAGFRGQQGWYFGGQDRNVIDSTVVSAIECTIHSKPSECDLGSFCVVCGRAYPGVLKRPDVSAFFKNPDASSLFRRDTMS